MQTRRQEILIILKQKGEATVDELATILDLTPVTVRHHLDILRAEGLVEAPAVRRRRGPGRPQYVYTLTPASADHFPQNYDGLVNELLTEIKATMEPVAIKELFDKIAERRLEQAPSLDSDLSHEERMDKLVDYLTESGFIADWEPQENGHFYLIASNCPYENVAKVHPELCKIDLHILQELSGSKIDCLQRITEGSHNCVYQIALREQT